MSGAIHFVTKNRLQAILALGLPIIGGMVSQTIINLVDTAMVGTLGDAAIAAVGVASFTNFVCQAFILALGTGVQAIAARRLGEGREGEMAEPLNGGLLLVVVIGVPLATVLILLAPGFFVFLNEDPQVQSLGVDYLQIRLLAMVPTGMNFAFRGYFNGVNRSQIYLRTLLVIHISNVAISYVLIFGKLGFPALGTNGAAIGTASALTIGTLVYAVLAWRYARSAGFLRHRRGHEVIGAILRLSVPMGINQVLFSGGFTVLFWIIGQLGDPAANVAAANVLVNIMLFAILPGMALGMAANSLVGQALGRGDKPDARRWGWDVVKVSVLLMALLGLPMLLAPRLLLSIFIHTPDTLELARLPLQVVGAAIAIDGVSLVLMQALLGAGASRTVLLVSSGLQWFVFLPAAYFVGPVLGLGLLGVWVAQAGHRSLLAVVFGLVWQRSSWADIKV